MRIAIFGCTGDLGRGLAINFAAAGHEIIVGSRSQERAEGAAADLSTNQPECTFTPNENVVAAELGELAIVSIPWEGVESTIPPMAEALSGKVVVSVVNALTFGKSGAIAVRDLAGGSSAERIQELAPEAKVVVAYNNLPAHRLQRREHLDADVLVCGRSREARERVIELTAAIPGTRALDAGPLANALIIEGMTAVIINLNRRYKGEAGLAVEGLEEAPGRPQAPTPPAAGGPPRGGPSAPPARPAAYPPPVPRPAGGAARRAP